MITLTIALLKKLLCSNNVLTKRQSVVISYSPSSSTLFPGKKERRTSKKEGWREEDMLFLEEVLEGRDETTRLSI
jgi:hypothetical protein